jgi:raffinose/stachyose/melibiose transport system permease protein
MNSKRLMKRETVYSLLAIIPALTIFLAFTYYPLISTLKYSFTNWDGFSKSYDFIGISNFLTIFKEEDVIKSFWNTIYFAVVGIALGITVQLTLAVFLFENFKGKKVIRAIFYLPCVISQLIVSLTWLGFFQYTGVINEALRALGMDKLVVDWLGNPATVMNVLIFINTWQWAGYGMVIFLTGLNSIPVDVYESAMLDGARGIKKFFYITLPLIMPSVTVTTFIGITGALKIFDMPYVLTGGGPLNASLTLSMSIYNNAFSYERFGYSSSIGLVFFVFIAVITIIQLRLTRRMEVEL